MKTRTFFPSDLLIPKDCQLDRWAVIACDQYINQEDYWQKVENFVGRAPSALRLTLPESCLDGPEMETDIMSVNGAMSEYLRGNLFETHENAMIYVERTLNNGKIRKGIVGMIDLEEFDYGLSATNQIRASEATTLQRIPPRVATRKNAPLELSHVILLADDDRNLIFNGISKENLLYDINLMEDGGNLKAWIINENEQKHIFTQTEQLGDEEFFREKYKTDRELLKFAVGDGNHSLVTAKECYERQKKYLSQEQWENLPARYAMVELVNLHDDAVELNSYHRVIHGVEPKKFFRDFRDFVEKFPENDLAQVEFRFFFQSGVAPMDVKNPLSPFPVITFEKFMAECYPQAHVDYIFEEKEARNMAEKENTVCIILPKLNKKLVFPCLIHHGILPEKSFTMGEPSHKRYYVEARKIR